MTEPVIIPMWMYESLCAKDSKKVVDARLAEMNIVPVASWRQLSDLAQVKDKVNRD